MRLTEEDFDLSRQGGASGPAPPNPARPYRGMDWLVPAPVPDGRPHPPSGTPTCVQRATNRIEAGANQLLGLNQGAI